MKEFRLIQRLFSQLPPKRPEELIGPGDDCAVLRLSKNKTLLLTTDMLLERVHFRRDWATLRDIGRRSLLVNMSDIAAMGGVPRFALISVGLPKNLKARQAEKLFQGMADVCRENGISIVGGDTNASDRLVINVALIGEALKGKFLTRRGAKVGDALYVSGTLGDSALALRARKHRMPPNRISLGQSLVHNKYIHSLIDLSDGLVGDLGHILEASKVGVEVSVDRLPVSKASIPLSLQLGGGEDYELLFTASPKWKVPRRICGIPITKIGKIIPKKWVMKLIDSEGRRLPKAFKITGFEHF